MCVHMSYELDYESHLVHCLMPQFHLSHYYLIVRLSLSFSTFKMNLTHIQKYNLSTYYWQ